MSNFRSIDRQTGFLLPPSVDEWLPEKHLARFVVEVIDVLDLCIFSLISDSCVHRNRPLMFMETGQPFS